MSAEPVLYCYVTYIYTHTRGDPSSMQAAIRRQAQAAESFIGEYENGKSWRSMDTSPEPGQSVFVRLCTFVLGSSMPTTSLTSLTLMSRVCFSVLRISKISRQKLRAICGHEGRQILMRLPLFGPCTVTARPAGALRHMCGSRQSEVLLLLARLSSNGLRAPRLSRRRCQ